MLLGCLAGLTALIMGLGQERALKEKDGKSTSALVPVQDESALPMTPCHTEELGNSDLK